MPSEAALATLIGSPPSRPHYGPGQHRSHHKSRHEVFPRKRLLVAHVKASGVAVCPNGCPSLTVRGRRRLPWIPLAVLDQTARTAARVNDFQALSLCREPTRHRSSGPGDNRQNHGSRRRAKRGDPRCEHRSAWLCFHADRKAEKKLSSPGARGSAARARRSSVVQSHVLFTSPMIRLLRIRPGLWPARCGIDLPAICRCLERACMPCIV